MHALLVAAAEGAAETSKTAFYLAGGALAAWAVILSALGLSRPEFPGSDGAARGVMAISTVLVIAAMAAAVATG
ncbi:MAG: hypothetical protein JWM73_1668 [Solirubrobacterales bacterium]|jgi:hypothetical protein|nr:hypothetical protein [Solirubrobacterales bacterium]